ncbi:TPA: AbiA family abortive infection protein [Staphylococcus aureus]|nr:AbiA family abortive infection protein [Staphylococcus aureus]HDD0316054.1 AbiA family abortive infection protein [Staphylococcus aureus]HDD0480715.1 AbiA family abortive infection protein [Staphylococcus aureus]HDD0694830.1 AbiA family abortive infection protein [Staphylococcus aureus]
MININFNDWEKVCKSFFNLNKAKLESYIQWYPFSKLTENSKCIILSEKFFLNFIKNGAIFKEYNTFNFPSHYSQKTSASFRNMTLVYPFVYLYIEVVGYHISKKYTRKSKYVRCYYSGDLSENEFSYKNSYDKFFADINALSSTYDNFYKFDISNFFDAVDINLLFKLINEGEEILDTRSSLIYKRLLQQIGGNKFPTLENSSALSYLATYIYLDKVDYELEKVLQKNSKIESFQIIRYVDDLYIFFNTMESELNLVSSEIKNVVIDAYRKVKLNLNENKTKLGKSSEVNETLSAALYSHYVHKEEIDIAHFYDKNKIRLFLDDLYNLAYSHNHENFKYILDKHFTKEGITYSSDEVLRYLAYYEDELFQDEVIIYKVKRLILTDYNFIKYKINIFLRIILNTNHGDLIRYLLNELFKKDKFNSFDIAISLNYLLLRNFQHTDLMYKIRAVDSDIIDYINRYCKQDFLKELDKEYNYIIKLNLNREFSDSSLKVWYLYFLYKYYDKNGDTLEAFAYYKTYFDRMVSLLMYYKKISIGKKESPNYKRHYKVGNAQTDFEKLNARYYKNKNVSTLLSELYKLRNFNPINHSSAEIIEDKMLKKSQITNLIKQAETLLFDSFSS